MRRHIDLNLLVCLDALLTERSVTRAAHRLGMSQPGMSNALARLRTLTGDPLLVRSGNEFRPTERALSLAHKVRSGLAALEDIFADESVVDPATAIGTVTVAAADSISVMLVPKLAESLSTSAPGVQLIVRQPDPARFREWLIEGECDIALGYFPDLADDLRSMFLFDQPMRCISGPMHPLAGAEMDVDQYVACTHVIFGSPFSPRSTMELTVDRTLEALGKTRVQRVQVSSALLVPHIVASSSHVALVPMWLGRHYAAFLPLEVRPLPFEAPRIHCRMLWHERTHRVGLQRWIRQLLRSLTEQLVSEDPSGTLRGAIEAASR